MAQLDARQPTRVYRGTVDEVFSHRGEIPDDAQLELKVYEPDDDTEVNGKSLADVVREIGTVKGLPEDLSTNPKYMRGFGETRDVRDL